MLYAAKTLAGDFLTAIAFIAIYAPTGNLPLALGAVLVIAVGQVGWAVRRKRRLDPMVWLSLFLALAFGAASLIADDPRYVMVKPSVVHFALAVVMLRRGWMLRYLPEDARARIPETVLVASGYAWAALMLVLGVANLVVAWTAPFAAWAWFVSLGLGGAKLFGFAVQYLVFRLAAMRASRFNPA